MDSPFIKRSLYPEELRLLKSLRSLKEKAGSSKIKFHHYLIAGFGGAVFTYLANLTSEQFWVFPFGTLAVFFYSFILFVPWEIYKLRQKHQKGLKQLNELIQQGTVNSWPIHAKRIAVAREFEDEGDLFMIELESGKILCLWDYDYHLKKKFPCLAFEIYEESFATRTGRMVLPLSEKIEPVWIDKKLKWQYLEKNGSPAHLQIINTPFEQLIGAFNQAAGS